MRRFWEARAQEDPYFFVDNRLHYGKPDLERFWAGGREAVDDILGSLGVSIPAGATAIDIGCGVGRTTRVLAERAALVKAIDVSERMLEVAREVNPHLTNVEWIHGDGISLAGIADASADVVFEFVVFHHIPDPAITLGYIADIGRVLRPGGWAAIQVSNQPHKHARQRFGARLRGAVRAMRRRGPRGQNHPAWRGSSIDLQRLREVAERSGMSVERVEGAGTIYCLVLLRKARA